MISAFQRTRPQPKRIKRARTATHTVPESLIFAVARFFQQGLHVCRTNPNPCQKASVRASLAVSLRWISNRWSLDLEESKISFLDLDVVGCRSEHCLMSIEAWHRHQAPDRHRHRTHEHGFGKGSYTIAPKGAKNWGPTDIWLLRSIHLLFASSWDFGYINFFPIECLLYRIPYT